MEIGDRIVTYDPSCRVYLLGTISGDYRYDPSVDPDDPNARSVTWDGEVSRDLLTVATKNSLGSISTLFLVPESAAVKTQQPASESSVEDEDTGEDDLFKRR